MRAVDTIRAKRDGDALSREAIEAFVTGVTDGSWPDYQASALLMAIVLKGMNPVETAWLTDATSTARTGTSSIGSITFFTRWMFCLIETEPDVMASMVPMYGIRPVNT